MEETSFKHRKEKQVIFVVSNSFSESFNRLKMITFGIFQSTYVCKQIFSNMNFI